ncbi:MAG: hypothetical protein ACD_87C00312G0001 [uncultured bacterium]|nr:MAG: hypothetical protein ACD_87C00312G0001 [uncultured bacterium]
MTEFMGKREAHPVGKFFIHVMVVIDDDSRQVSLEIGFHAHLRLEAVLRFNSEF